MCFSADFEIPLLLMCVVNSGLSSSSRMCLMSRGLLGGGELTSEIRPKISFKHPNTSKNLKIGLVFFMVNWVLFG